MFLAKRWRIDTNERRSCGNAMRTRASEQSGDDQLFLVVASKERRRSDEYSEKRYEPKA